VWSLPCIGHGDKKKEEGIRLSDILVVREFPDVFSDELLEVPPEREVEVSIDILADISPIA